MVSFNQWMCLLYVLYPLIILWLIIILPNKYNWIKVAVLLLFCLVWFWLLLFHLARFCVAIFFYFIDLLFFSFFYFQFRIRLIFVLFHIIHHINHLFNAWDVKDNHHIILEQKRDTYKCNGLGWVCDVRSRARTHTHTQAHVHK